MKNQYAGLLMLLAVFFLNTKVSLHAQDTTFNYTTDGTTVTITGYEGSTTDPVLAIPSTLDGLPVTQIAELAFASWDNFTNIIIPNTVTNIGEGAFIGCYNVVDLTVAPDNPDFTGTNGALLDKNETTLLAYPGASGTLTLPSTVTTIVDHALTFADNLTNAIIPASITSIGSFAFDGCSGLGNVVVPDSVTNFGQGVFVSCNNLTNAVIGNGVSSLQFDLFNGCTNLPHVIIGRGVTNIDEGAFTGCYSLTSIFFTGNAPLSNLDSFAEDWVPTNAIVYYLPGTTGWGPTFGGLPTMLWNPQAVNDSTFGVHNSQFGFTIAGTTGLKVIVEACTNISNAAWIPVSTNLLVSGTSYFSDTQWTNYPGRFYRFSN